MKKTVFLGIYLLFSLVTYAQINIKGVVTERSGETIPGVNVVLKGTNQGVITDLNGAYNIVAPEDGILIFSFVGFKSVEIPIEGRNTIDVQLTSDMEEIDEVVVVGYGQMRKSDITGSVSSVKLDEVKKAGASVDMLLQGKTSGVFVSSTSAEPGANVNVRIRGLNSLSVSNQPLYVIDGIPFDVDINTPSSMGENSAKTYSPLVGLNPQDIESIEILKDASATAIYGSRGANGVVLITTKGGKKGRSELVFTSSVSVSQVSKQIDVLSPLQYAEFRNEYAVVDAEITGEEPSLPYDGVNGPLPEEVMGYNWQDEVFRSAVSQEHNLSLFGSNDNTNYYISLGVSQNEGVVLNSSLDRYSFSSRLNSELNSWLKIASGISYTYATGKGTSTSGDTENVSMNAINWTLSKSPIANEWSDEYIDPEDLEQTTPLDFVNQYVSHPSSNTLRGNLALTFDLFKGVSFETKFGLNYASNKRKQYWPKTLPMVEDQGRAGYGNSEQLSYTLNNLLHYNLNFNKVHKLNGVVGIETNEKYKETFKVSGDGFADDALTYYGLESAALFSPADLDRSKSTLFSVLARANYSYKNKYLATITGRYDGSSKFSQKKKYGFFPSFSLAWRISQEGFLKNSDVVSNLKLRAGWGQVGNQGLPAYSSLGLYSSAIYPLNGVSTSGYVLSDFEKSVTWETTEQLNAGIDLGLFNNRVMLSVDAYEKLSKDILIRRTMPLSSGYATAWTNMGQIENRGVDIELNTRIIDQVFKWDLGGNFSLYRNKIEKLNLPTSSYGYAQFWGSRIPGFNEPVNTFVEGEPIGLFWGYISEGLFQTDEEIALLNQNAQDLGKGDYYQFGLPQYPGDIKYKDVNGDGIVNDEDKTIIGDPNPDFTYGINTTFSYKGLSLNAFFSGVHGVDVFNQNLRDMTHVGRNNKNIIQEAYVNAWRGEGTTNYWPRIQNNWQQNYLLPSDRLVENGSYLRLQQLTLAYQVPVDKVKWLKGLNVSVSGNNLFTITDYSWWNPEANAYGNSNSAIGIDRNSYPFTRSYMFSLSLTL